jgi:actin related protein 2/3 complex subunit 5
MSEYAFRKIDIDAYDEDVLLPSDLYDPDPRGPDGVTADAKQRSNEARGQVSKYVK